VKLAARVLLAIGAAWALVLLAASLSGGWRAEGFSVTTSKPLRFALLALFIGWALLPRDEQERLSSRVSPRVLLGTALGFAAVYGIAFRITRWLAFDNAAFDLSLFESTLYETLQGHFMFAWGLGRNLFSEHFEPVVLFLLPVWVPFKHPLVLSVVQQLAVTFAVVPLYLSVRALGLDRRFAALAGAAWLLNAVVWQASREDFHPELFAPLAVFWALHASVTRRWPSLYLALFFALCLKEEMALVMLCFASLVLKGPPARRWPHALAVAALSVAWGVIAFRWVMPAAHPLGAELHPLAGRWAHLGSTYPQMVLGLLSRPGWVLGRLFSRPTLELLASLGFVPLLDPLSVLAALPPLLLHLTGSYEYAARLGAYYGLLPACLLGVGMVFALERAHRRWGERAALALGALALVAMPTWLFLDRPRAADLHAAAFMRTLPPKDVVCAQSPLAPHHAPDPATLQLMPHCTDPAWVLFAHQHPRGDLKEPEEYDAFVQRYRDLGFTEAFAEGEYLFLRRP
jgi:uncharacterized membrane protein